MFGWYTSQDVDRLIAKKKYSKAVRILRLMLEKHPGDLHLRQKLADTLALDGDTRESTVILEGLVKEFTDDGFHTKAIAITKKIQRIDPERGDLAETLANLMHHREQSRQTSANLPPLPLVDSSLLAVPPADAESEKAAEAALEATRSRMREPETEAPRETTPEDVETQVGEILEEIDASPTDAPKDGSVEPVFLEDDDGEDDTPEEQVNGIYSSPIFKEFSPGELEVLIQGLDLLIFEPGQVIIAEGEPGTSLLVIASGRVRVHVRNDMNRQVEIRQMGPGDFLGEISILTGQPRSATVTAAEHTEILELSTTTLARIEEEFPHVAIVVRQMCDERAMSPEERRAREELNLPI